MGHALRKAVGLIADQQGRGLAEVAQEAGATLLGGPTSLKAALDCDWDDPDQRQMAWVQVLMTLIQVEAWVQAQEGADLLQSPSPSRSANKMSSWRTPDARPYGKGRPRSAASPSKTGRCAMGGRAKASALMRTTGHLSPWGQRPLTRAAHSPGPLCPLPAA